MKAVRIALIVSVALNLLVAGVLFGAWVGGGSHRDSRIRGAGPMAPFAAAMSPDDRQALLAGLRRGGGRDARAQYDEFATRFAELLDAIRAEPFDAVRLESLLAAQRAAGVARQEEGERLLVERIAEMSAAERTAYAERLEVAFQRPRRR